MFDNIVLPLDGLVTDTTYLHNLCFIDVLKHSYLNMPTIKTFEEQKIFRRYTWLDDYYDLTHQQKEVIILNKDAIYEEELEDIEPDDIYPGIRELFIEAKKEHITVYCYSASRLASKLIQQLGISSLVTLIALEQLADISCDFFIIDDKHDLNLVRNMPNVTLALSPNKSFDPYPIISVQNTEELTLCYLIKLWKEHDKDGI
ncbi:hypothetical protein JNUCC83_01870 [Vagococcus sp. JNUCC 83]